MTSAVSRAFLIFAVLACAPLAAQERGRASRTVPAAPPAARSSPFAAPGMSPARAAAAAVDPVVYHGRSGGLAVDVPRVDTEPDIDGELDEAVWGRAALLTGFSEYSPVDRLPAEDSTEVLVMYGADAMYFGIRAFENHGDVVATLADRDRVGTDDHVQIFLDTFDDQRRALIFAVNGLGVQSDGTFADGVGPDLNPDFLFESHGRVTANGYQVEVRLPFKSIRYRETDEQRWGIQIMRRVMHSGHEQTWTPADRSAPSFLSQSGSLEGLVDLRRGLVLDLNPVTTARAAGSPRPGGAGGWDYDGDRPEFGGTVRWGVTPNVSVNATVNPDFSQVEADVGQVVYDPRLAVSYPEKRPFFLEANENFQVPNGLIYTRSIVAPVAAAKASGRMGDLTFGALSAVDDDLLDPAGGDHPVFNVFRLRRDVGPQSNVGLVYTDRMQGSDYNRVLGVDTRLLAGPWVLSGQVATSFTAAEGMRALGRPLFDLGVLRTGREYGFNFSLEGIHPEFVAGAGFLSRTGIARAVFVPRRTWYPSGDGAVESITFTPIFDNTWEWDRFTSGTEPNDIKVNTSTTARLSGGWQATVYTWTESFKYPDYLYTNYRVERRDALGQPTDTVPFVGTDRLTNLGVMLRLGTPQWQGFSGSAEVLGGQDDNFDEWSSAWILYSTIEGDWRPTDKVRVNGRFLEQRVYRKTDNSLVRLRTIPRVKLEYQLSRPLFLRFVGQYDGLRVDALRDDSRTGDPILRLGPGGYTPVPGREGGRFRMDWLVSYRPNPGTVFFAGYGSTLDADRLYDLREVTRSADGFFLKLSYLFRL